MSVINFKCKRCRRVFDGEVGKVRFSADAPEIAQAMLMRQQALALIDARKTIVHGAVSIVRDAVEQLKAAGLEVGQTDRDALISNLLVVLCSGERAQPVLQVQASGRTHGTNT